jgi:hypothetical protein
LLDEDDEEELITLLLDPQEPLLKFISTGILFEKKSLFLVTYVAETIISFVPAHA